MSDANDFSAYTVSIHYDRRLYRQDIAGSTAHARMLARQGIIGEEDAAAIIEGLGRIRQEIESGDFPWDDIPGRPAHEHRAAAAPAYRPGARGGCTPGAPATTR